MCQCFRKCFWHFSLCIAVSINVVRMIIGLGLIAGGIYGKTQLNVREILGNYYEQSVPPMDKFVGMGTSDDTSNLMQEADEFKKKSLDDMAGIADKAFDAVIGVGVIMVVVAVVGIIAFTRCKENRPFLIVFMALVFVLLIIFIVFCAMVGDDSILLGVIFEKLDNIALKEKSVNRFFMAAIQTKLECCGVRGNVDYYCHGVYDFNCNPGCETFIDVWNEMVQNAKMEDQSPMCTTTSESVDNCKTQHSANDCDNHLNMKKPVDGSQTKYCKDSYQDKYETIEDSTSAAKYKEMKKQLEDKDPAYNNTFKTGDPKVYGSLLNENIKGTQGCGFAIWDEVNMHAFLTIAVIVFVIIILMILFQILMAGLCLWWSPGKKSKSEAPKSKSKSKLSSESLKDARPGTKSNKEWDKDTSA